MPHLDTSAFGDLELRDHYAQTGLAHYGITFERAMAMPGTRLALINSADAARRADMRRALAHPVTHYQDGAWK